MDHILPSPIGPLRLTVAGGLLCRVSVEKDAAPTGDPTDPVLTAAAAQLREYFAGDRRTFDLPLYGGGTAFQRAVWRALGDVPFGETRSYAELARAVGRPAATRAVGAANGRNPLGIVVSCHRVVGSDGRLTGYAGGIEAKRWLLAHEAQARGR